MHSKPIKVLTVLLGLYSTHTPAQSNVVEMSCSQEQNTIEINLGLNGDGRMSVDYNGTKTTCPLKTEEIKGPPFTQHAGDMLLIEALVGQCTPIPNNDILMNELFVHIYEQESTHPTGRLLVVRRTRAFDCKVTILDLKALKPLHEQLEDSH
jgi:hypothetical protein